jgi:hypothetical protein
VTQEEIDALPDEMTIALKKPVEVAGQTYTTLTFREPTAGQLKEASATQTDMQGTFLLLALSAGVVPAVIDRLTARELKKAGAFVQSFTEDAQQTGAPA